MPMSEAFSISFILYTLIKLLHKSSERSSLVSGPGLNCLLWRPRILRLIVQQQPFIPPGDLPNPGIEPVTSESL